MKHEIPSVTLQGNFEGQTVHYKITAVVLTVASCAIVQSSRTHNKLR